MEYLCETSNITFKPTHLDILIKMERVANQHLSFQSATTGQGGDEEESEEKWEDTENEQGE